MRNGFRLIVGLALVCALALGVTACGGSDDSTGASGATSDPSEISGTVTVWDIVGSFSPDYVALTEKRIKEFEREYPDVTVKYVEQPHEGYEPVYKAAFVAQEGPDALTMPVGPAAAGSYSQALEILNDRIPPEMQEDILNWSAVTESLTEEGEYYGIPVASSGPIFYYNKELFEKAGLPREFEPKTWEEVKEAGEKLEAAGIQAFTGGDKEGYETAFWFALGWQTVNTPEQAIEMAQGALPITDPAFAKAFEPALMIQEAGLYPDDRFETPYFPDGAARFGEGKGAMATGIRSLTAYYGEYNETLGEENVGMFLPPGSKYFSTEAEWVWTIPKFSENKDAAWAFVEFMSSKEFVTEIVDAEITLPNYRGVQLPADAPEQARQLVEWGEELEVFLPAASTVPVPGELFYREMNSALQGRSSMEQVQQSLQETAEKTGSR